MPWWWGSRLGREQRGSQGWEGCVGDAVVVVPRGWEGMDEREVGTGSRGASWEGCGAVPRGWEGVGGTVVVGFEAGKGAARFPGVGRVCGGRRGRGSEGLGRDG